MDDNYFDDKLKNILKSAPEFQPDQTALDGMKDKLRSIQKPKKRRGGFLLLLPLLLLPLIWGAGFIHKKFDTLQQQVLQLNEQVNQLNQLSQEKETIVEKQIIHHYDTIYNVIYRETYIKENNTQSYSTYASRYQTPKLYSNYLNPLRVHISSVYDWIPGSFNNSLLTAPGSSIFGNNVASSDIKTGNEIPAALLKSFQLNSLQSAPFSLIGFPLKENIKEDFPEYKNGKLPTSYFFTPSGFSLSANYSPYMLPLHEFGGSAKSYGLKAAIQFPEGRQLEIGADLLNMKFESKDPTQYAVFPYIAPNDPADIIAEVKGDFTYLQIPVTLRQTFLRKNKLKPMLSVGLVAYKPITTDIIYEYVNPSIGEYKVIETFKNGVFSVDNLRLGLGAEYDLNSKFSAYGEMQYQHGFSLNSNEYFKLQYWSLNLGVGYRL